MMIHDSAGKLPSFISYTASGGTTFFGLFTSNDLAVFAGVLIALFTAAVNWHHKREVRRLMRQQIEAGLTRRVDDPEDMPD